MIKDYYDENISSFQNEEKRLIDMLSFSDASSESKKRIQEIKLNSELFDAEITSRGLETDDISLGFVEKPDSKDNKNLIELFNKEKIGIYGPYKTDLGIALYRIREIVAENETSLLSAKSDIRKLLASEKAKNEVFKILEDLNNEVAAGQTLEDLESKISISIESLEIENNKLPDRFQNDPNVEELFKNANDQITEFVLLADNSLLAMKVEDEKKERNLSLQEASKDIEEILRKENTFIAAKSYFDQKFRSKKRKLLNPNI